MAAGDGVLVIGGTGVIGHFVVRRLVGLGLRPVVASPTANTEFLVDVLDRIDVLRADLNDAEQIEALVRERGVGRIVHLAAVLHQVTEADPPRAVRVLVEGTASLLQTAVKTGVRRVIFASSKAAYGPVTGRHAHPTYAPLTEDLPARPASVYGIVKLAGEQLGAWYAERHGIEFAALRFGSTVGPGKLRRHGSTSIHSKIVESAMVGVAVRIEKGGEAVTDTVFNDDVAQGVVGALMAPRLNHRVYNVATGTGITLPQFADAVRRRFPGARIEIGPGTQYLRADSAGHCILDVSRAAADFGYRPDPDPDRMVANYLATMERLKLASDVKPTRA